MSALALGAGIGQGEIDASELCDYFLERIERIDTEHNIYLRTTPERARTEAAAAAERARQGLRLSPLDGVPISWKELYDTAGDVTSHGAKVLQERVAVKDATVVARATKAGLVCLGKTNQTEFARWLDLGWRRICFSWTGGGRHRIGYRWLGARAGGLEQPHRAQNQFRLPAARGRTRPLHQHGHGRPARP